MLNTTCCHGNQVLTRRGSGVTQDKTGQGGKEEADITIANQHLVSRNHGNTAENFVHTPPVTSYLLPPLQSTGAQQISLL